MKQQQLTTASNIHQKKKKKHEEGINLIFRGLSAQDSLKNSTSTLK